MNSGILVFIGIVSVVFGGFQIALMFKLWNLCDDVKQLKDKICGISKISSSNTEKDDFKINEICFVPSLNKTVKIISIDGTEKYKCEESIMGYSKDDFEGSGNYFEFTNNDLTKL